MNKPNCCKECQVYIGDAPVLCENPKCKCHIDWLKKADELTSLNDILDSHD